MVKMKRCLVLVVLFTVDEAGPADNSDEKYQLNPLHLL